MNDKVISWLLEDDNPAVKYRTQTEILGQVGNKSSVIKWLIDYLPVDWKETKYIRAVYYLTAFAESGLNGEDIPLSIEEFFCNANIFPFIPFRNGCGDFMNLRALVRLGLADEQKIVIAIRELSKSQLPDGGFLCETHIKK